MRGIVTLAEIESGAASVERLLDINALLDMQDYIESQQADMGNQK
ncbi:hypothetical protein OLZ31_02350 [Enterobacter asburiae]|nr:hypothetical protein [Enterobacter asburiae]